MEVAEILQPPQALPLLHLARLSIPGVRPPLRTPESAGAPRALVDGREEMPGGLTVGVPTLTVQQVTLLHTARMV